LQWLLYLFGAYLIACYLWAAYLGVRLYTGHRVRGLWRSGWAVRSRATSAAISVGDAVESRSTADADVSAQSKSAAARAA
jgi:hypothetical protein